MDFGFTAVPAIATICYLAATGIKATTLNKKWLPVVCMSLGGALGAVAMRAMPDYPAGDILTAIAIGIASGAAAVAAHQAYKQLGGK